MSNYNRIIPPITEETTLDNARRWLRIIRFTESGTVLQLQDDCEYRIGEIMNNRNILKTILGPYFRKYLLSYISIDTHDLLDSIHASLVSLAIQKKIGTKGTLQSLSNQDLLVEIAERGFDVGLFIVHITPLLRKKEFQPLFDLEYLIRVSKNLSAIVFSELDITHPSYHILADKASFLFDHLLTYPLYKEQDAEQFIQHYCHEWKVTFPEKVKKEIIRESGGYLWLIHHCMRTLRDNPAMSVIDAFCDEILIRKVDTVWNKLTSEEQTILRKIHYGTILEKDTLSHEYAYLKKIRFIHEVQGNLALGIPLLSRVVDWEDKLSSLSSQNSSIFIGGRDISKSFTTIERSFLSPILSSKKKIISRELLALSIWGSRWEEKYSDWALDRIAYRVRRKLSVLGFDDRLLQTVKKKGYRIG